MVSRSFFARYCHHQPKSPESNVFISEICFFFLELQNKSLAKIVLSWAAVGGGSAEGLAGYEHLCPVLRAAALRSLWTGWWKGPSDTDVQ